MRTKAPVRLTSSKNPLLKEVRRAVSKGTPTDSGYAVAESFHLLEEALRSNREIGCVLVAESVRSAVAQHIEGLRGARVYALGDALFREVASTENSQGVITLVKPPAWTLDELFRGRSMVVILDGIQDPGNAGTIVRTAEAFGATGCIFVKGTVSPFNPKALRASAGSLFRLPVMAGLDSDLVRTAVRQRRVDLYATKPKGGKPLAEADLTRRFALVVGSEGRGVSERLQGKALDLSIPTTGVESLNVALASGIILYEARRQRMPG